MIGGERQKTISFSYCIILFFAAVRVLISYFLGVWFPAGQIWDDSLLVEYADFAGHFGTPNRSALLKTMGYPLFLKAVSISHIPYTIVLGLLWVVAALFVYFLVKRLNNGKWGLALAAYIYILFLPQAFDFWSGTRLYRNGMMAPFVIVTFVLLIHMILDICLEKGSLLLHSLLLGACFSYTYYIKEDGLWLMACLIFALLFAIVCLVIKKKISLKKIACLAIPILIWGITTLGYKGINYKYFGVFDINTRTESAYGRFMENVYKTDAPNRSLYVWAPFGAIDAVFEASPTLQSHPELLKAIHNTGWAEDLSSGHEIPGDHFAFALREEMYALGMFMSEASFQSFFEQVNLELKEAFRTKQLKKADRIQLLASTGGYTGEEVLSLFPLVGKSFRGAVLLNGYQLGLGRVSDWEIEHLAATVSFAEMMTHITYLDDYSVIWERSEKTAGALQPLVYLYRAVNAVLFAALILVILLEAVRFLKNIKSVKALSADRKNIFLNAFAALVFSGISVCYAFSISWFSAFCFADGVNMTILNFYNIALPGLLAFAFLFALLAIKGEMGIGKNETKG